MSNNLGGIASQSGRKTVGVIFGGKSCEHDISIITAVQAMNRLDREKYNIVPIYIDRDGNFNTGKGLDKIADFVKPKLKRVHFLPQSNVLYSGIFRICRIDVALLCTHGVGVEDGALQGYLETINIPYTSCGILASAVGMDKIIMKYVFSALDVPVLEFMWTDKSQFDNDSNAVLKNAENIGYPLIVKPANLGSSIGIKKANNKEELVDALEVAFCYDHRILIERAITNLTEINCAVISVEGNTVTSVLEQPISWESFLSFDQKYINGGGKKGGMASHKRKLPAEIDEGLAKEIADCAKIIYEGMACSGAVRIDYIIDKTENKVFVNEINTIPGSLSYYIWEYSGFTFPKLLDILIENAEERWRKKQSLTYTYKSDVLKVSGGKGGK